MIVRRAELENGCTVWCAEGEPGDRDLPRTSLWINGLLRTIPPALEALWLTLTLGPFARRLVVPGVLDEPLAVSLSALAGVQIASAVGEAGAEMHSGTYGAVLARDSLDDYLAMRAGITSTFSLSASHDLEELQATHGSFRVVANAGTFRRCLDPFDRVGELAAAVMVAPLLRIGEITAFACREELAGLDVPLLTDAASRAGIRLNLPMAQVGVKALGALVNDSPSSTIAFSALYRRYRMFPAIIARIHEDMKAGLVAGNGDDVPARIAGYLASRVSQQPRE
jgi:hypothetical protein